MRPSGKGSWINTNDEPNWKLRKNNDLMVSLIWHSNTSWAPFCDEVARFLSPSLAAKVDKIAASKSIRALAEGLCGSLNKPVVLLACIAVLLALSGIIICCNHRIIVNQESMQLHYCSSAITNMALKQTFTEPSFWNCDTFKRTLLQSAIWLCYGIRTVDSDINNTYYRKIQIQHMQASMIPKTSEG